MKLSTTDNSDIFVIQSPAYPEMSTPLNAYLGLINHWDEESIASIKQLKTLALDENDKVIREFLINVKQDTLLDTVERSLDMARQLEKVKKVMLVQNEPFKDIYPGPREKSMARKFWAYANTLGLLVVDQLVVSENSYYSYQENKVIQNV